uniref:Reverse transcriptase domain-containing protein n=2 Tax=Meloidogyne incognita TaxID=6306 RepID=A0A914NZT4_MELIC
MDDLTLTLENKKSVDIIYFDLSKAFDTISHERLLCKLKLLNIPDTPTEWLRDTKSVELSP